ncbi:hypothetical protein K7X08_020010 [Anisodus acutangulus]|uniref:Uncharacterized protein n=1 Tax=Anisodus acutangulus TaxID=402998 RepID=A0A9Q1MSQ0_9SOLA|nr:hypothetical protein K7X08_020010 [Anisodus acutangulus]
MLFIDEHNGDIYHLFLWKLKQVAAEKPITEAKGESAILQESIIKTVNENAKACIQPSVSQFKRLLGVKLPSEGDLKSVPILTHPKLMDLPKEFDARTAWPQCSIIGRILDQVTLFLLRL